jgi:hypothetical protein
MYIDDLLCETKSKGRGKWMVQVCPHCKRTINEDEFVCPFCNTDLSKDTDWVKEKRQYYDRLNRVYVLGFFLLFTALGYWMLISRGIIYPNRIAGVLFALIWLAGFTLYFIYWRKGDRGFIWI